MLRLLLWLVLPVFAAGCAQLAEPVWAPDADVSRARYVHPGPAALTLYTVINNYHGRGEHSALMVDGAQRVIFDPAGTFYHPHLPERNDVHFGMSDPAVDFYIDYHARESYHVVEQTLTVSPEVAAMALQAVQDYGAVPKTQCARAVSDILAGLPGFESTPRTMSPRAVMNAFGAHPGVRERKIRDDSPDDNTGLIQAPPLLHQQAGFAGSLG